MAAPPAPPAPPERKSFPLRVDPNLWTELEAWAEQELRSVNGQIEYILREAVRRRKRSAAPKDNALLSKGTKTQNEYRKNSQARAPASQSAQPSTTRVRR